MITKLLLVGLLTVALLPAQRGGGGGRGGGEGGGAGAPGTPSRIDMIENMLKLNHEQKRDIKSTLDQGQKDAAPLRDQIAKSELEIGEAVSAGNPQPDIDKAINNFATLEAQMATIEMKAFAKIYHTLDKEQQGRAAPVFFMMQGVFKTKNWNDVRP
jgi:hypothetical protein